MRLKIFSFLFLTTILSASWGGGLEDEISQESLSLEDYPRIWL